MQVLAFGKELLFLAVCLTGLIFVLSVAGVCLRDRRFVVSARVGIYALLILVGGSAACLVHGFLTGQYNNEYIWGYSERALGTPFKVAGLWAGLDGSMLFWTLILCVYAAACAFQHRWSSRHPVGRRLEPYVYVFLSLVIGFFAAVVYYVTNPFAELPLERRLQLSPDGIVPDGRGLNPQLENYWMAIHPPCLYLGLVGFTVPFAFAMAALLAGEMGDYWIKITRRWTLVTWTILTCGVVLGGLWAYEMLGWGGYWAWDPVENASILPWFVGTAFLHSVMVQERRDMLKGWNVFLIILTFFMTIIATYMTRSGVVQSFHAFAEGGVDEFFLPFLIGIAVLGAFLMGLRGRFLRGRHKLESLFSREAAFFFNNLILLALMLTVYLLSMAEKISHDFFLRKFSVREAVYNLVTTPLFLLLLLLTGLGPQLGWVKTSRAVFWKRVLWPGVAGAVVCLALLPYWSYRDTLPPLWGAGGRVASAQTVPENAPAAPQGPAAPAATPAGAATGAPASAEAEPASAGETSGARRFFQRLGPLLMPWIEKCHYYSTLLGIGFSVFIIATVFVELWRSAAARRRFRGESTAGAVLNVVLGNNRRYGGYIVHIGLAILAIGVIWSSNFRVKELLNVRQGELTPISDSGYSVTWVEGKSLPAGNPYSGEAVRFDISKGDRKLVSLWPELRHYPKNIESPQISIPAISRNFVNDYYIHYSWQSQDRRAFTIFVNPLVNWIWAGTVLMLVGGIFAALPMPRRRVGLAD
jgi:cytochrome c-type biogenesis protein CcmF